MFERFANSAILVIMRAQKEARRQWHNYVGPDHILLALIDNEELKFKNPSIEDPLPSIAAKVFEKHGVTLDATRKEADPLDPAKTSVAVEIPFTAASKRLLKRSWAVADELADSKIDTEHLLLALLEDDEGAAHDVLVALNLDKQDLREEALKLRAERYCAT